MKDLYMVSYIICGIGIIDTFQKPGTQIKNMQKIFFDLTKNII